MLYSLVQQNQVSMCKRQYFFKRNIIKIMKVTKFKFIIFMMHLTFNRERRDTRRYVVYGFLFKSVVKLI